MSEEEAALTLGASGFKTFLFVTLPNVKWALLYGVLLCNARAMGEFGAVSVVSGHIRGLTNTIPLQVEILYNEYNMVAAFALASLLAGLALVTLGLKTVLEWRVADFSPTAAATDVPRRGTHIRIEGVEQDFGSYPALRNVDLDIVPGELIALLGPSGSGKTTLLRVIAGLNTPDRGAVFFDGENATGLSVQERRAGFVFQNYALFKHLTVAENIAFGLKVRPRHLRPSRVEIAERVDRLLELVQLEGLGARFPAQLSGGSVSAWRLRERSQSNRACYCSTAFRRSRCASAQGFASLAARDSQTDRTYHSFRHP